MTEPTDLPPFPELIAIGEQLVQTATALIPDSEGSFARPDLPAWDYYADSRNAAHDRRNAYTAIMIERIATAMGITSPTEEEITARADQMSAQDDEAARRYAFGECMKTARMAALRAETIAETRSERQAVTRLWADIKASELLWIDA